MLLKSSDDAFVFVEQELLLRTQLGLRNHQHLLELLLLLLLLSLGRIAAPARDIHQELGQRVGESPLLNRREVLDGRGRGRESLDSLDFQSTRGSALSQSNTCPGQSQRIPNCSRLVGALGRLKLLPQVLVVDLGIVAELEDDETDGRLGEDEHVGRSMSGEKTGEASEGERAVSRGVEPLAVAFGWRVGCRGCVFGMDVGGVGCGSRR